MLDNKQHEQYAQCIALGVNSASECFENAGFQRDRQVAELLQKTPVIAARIREIEMHGTVT